ncbi:unnamed protein product [Microthlaspi erraticum]|uniref:Uncharacterized protein n=1 Tax=Microthlaspi erraticum TaxID=1685480 RepID=A0A6D2I757_9BRAS|nr:unnamed protein product [Microthlaspi erraticum]
MSFSEANWNWKSPCPRSEPTGLEDTFQWSVKKGIRDHTLWILGLELWLQAKEIRFRFVGGTDTTPKGEKFTTDLRTLLSLNTGQSGVNDLGEIPGRSCGREPYPTFHNLALNKVRGRQGGRRRPWDLTGKTQICK